MKKILLIFLLSQVVTVWAESSDQLIIHIHNEGSSDCILKRHLILFGHVSDHTQISESVLKGQKTSFTMRSDSGYHKSVLLTYACDVGQEITLFVDVQPAFSEESLVAKVFDAHNMTAKYTLPHSWGFYNPTEIDWSISSHMDI